MAESKDTIVANIEAALEEMQRVRNFFEVGPFVRQKQKVMVLVDELAARVPRIDPREAAGGGEG